MARLLSPYLHLASSSMQQGIRNRIVQLNLSRSSRCYGAPLALITQRRRDCESQGRMYSTYLGFLMHVAIAYSTRGSGIPIHPAFQHPHQDCLLTPHGPPRNANPRRPTLTLHISSPSLRHLHCLLVASSRFKVAATSRLGKPALRRVWSAPLSSECNRSIQNKTRGPY